MRKLLPICLIAVMSMPIIGCFNSKHETKETPSTTTIEHRSTVDTVPVEKHTTVERTY